MTRHAIVCASYLILRRGNEILLSLRQGTGWMDGRCSLPSGHLEAHESPRQALVREAREEIGILLHSEDLCLVHVMSKPLRDPDRIAFFFEATRYEGEPRNLEPNKCGGLKWVPSEALPSNVAPSVAQAVECIRKGERYSESEEME